jgi:hypothetical protein
MPSPNPHSDAVPEEAEKEALLTWSAYQAASPPADPEYAIRKALEAAAPAIRTQEMEERARENADVASEFARKIDTLQSALADIRDIPVEGANIEWIAWAREVAATTLEGEAMEDSPYAYYKQLAADLPPDLRLRGEELRRLREALGPKLKALQEWREDLELDDGGLGELRGLISEAQGTLDSLLFAMPLRLSAGSTAGKRVRSCAAQAGRSTPGQCGKSR